MKNKFIISTIAAALILSACSPVNNEVSNTQTPQATEIASATPTASKNAQNTSKVTNSITPKQTASTNLSKITLTQSELNYFTDYFNKTENNGFLQSSYTKPSGINLDEALYNGAGYGYVTLSKEESELYTKTSGNEIMTDITKLTTQEINSLLKKKADISLNDITSKFEWCYLEKYDAYYAQHGDTNLSTIECLSGYKTSNGLYTIKYKGSYIVSDSETCTVTLQKSGSDYLFVSNIKS